MGLLRAIAPACLMISLAAAAPGADAAGVDDAGAGSIALERIHAQVNAEIAPMDDMDQYGRDLWVAEPKPREAGGQAFGDCEDYALTKMTRLAAQGVPASAMAVEAVFTETGEHHAVLTVQWRGQTLVLDNRMPAPISKDALLKLGYRWGDNSAANWAAVFSATPSQARSPQVSTASTAPARRP